MIEAVMFWNEPNNKSALGLRNRPRMADFRRHGADGGARREGGKSRLAARAGRHVAHRPGLRQTDAGLRRARASRRGGDARFSARLEPLADQRLARPPARDPGRDGPAAVDFPRSASPPSARRKCRSSGCGAPPNCCAAGSAASTGIRSTICRAPGPPRRATARRRVRPITGTSTWGCCARTARRSWRSGTSPEFTPELGICQWFHFEDHRLDDAVAWFRRLGVKYLPHGPELGRQLPAERGGVVRPADERPGRVQRDGDVLLHAGAPRHRPAPQQRPAGRGRVRRFLRPDDPALRRVRRDDPGRARVDLKRAAAAPRPRARSPVANRRGRSCRNRHIVGYQGLSSRATSQRQSGAACNRVQTGRPSAPARCAGKLSTEITRSRACIARAALTASSEPEIGPNPVAPILQGGAALEGVQGHARDFAQGGELTERDGTRRVPVAGLPGQSDMIPGRVKPCGRRDVQVGPPVPAGCAACCGTRAVTP